MFILFLCIFITTCTLHSAFASSADFNGFASEILDWIDEEATKALNSSYAQYNVFFEPSDIEKNVSHHYVMGITKEGTSNTYYADIVFESSQDLSGVDGTFMFFPVDNNLWNDDTYYVILSSYVGYFAEKLTSAETDEIFIYNVLTEYLLMLNEFKTGDQDSDTELFLTNSVDETFGLTLYEREGKTNMVMLSYLKS